MKITQTQIDILVDVIVKKVYNRDELNKKLKDLQEEELKKFKKTTEYKNVIKLFQDNPMVSLIEVNKKYFFPDESPYYYDTKIYASKYENDLERIIKDKISSDFWKQYPEEFAIKRQIREELTIRALGGEDIREMIEDLTKQFKGKYNL